VSRFCRYCRGKVHRAPLQGGSRTILSNVWLHNDTMGLMPKPHRADPVDEGVLVVADEREGRNEEKA
jgi:hypothetical protein